VEDFWHGTSLTANTRGAQRHRFACLLRDYVALTKPRILAMVIVAWAVGFDLGNQDTTVSSLHLRWLIALLGLSAVTAGSSTFNQVLERAVDRLMVRTAARPIAQNRINVAYGTALGFTFAAAGLILLAFSTNLLSSALALLALAGYVLVYTPLKRRTQFNILIGAVFGALPPLIGWTSARGRIEWPGIALFAILITWQIPHVLAIGWLNRDDYIRAGIQIPANSKDRESSARRSSAWAVAFGALGIPVGLWPAYLHVAGSTYAIAAAGLGIWYLSSCVNFAFIQVNPEAEGNRRRARNLLKTSVIYLPVLLSLLALTSFR
jgi:heme o synthase